MSYQEDPEHNQIHIFIPKCRICKNNLMRDDVRGIVGQRDVGSVGPSNRLEEFLASTSVAPGMTYLRLLYRCQRHPDIFWNAPLDIIDKMNQYPPNSIVVHHVEF